MSCVLMWSIKYTSEPFRHAIIPFMEKDGETTSKNEHDQKDIFVEWEEESV